MKNNKNQIIFEEYTRYLTSLNAKHKFVSNHYFNALKMAKISNKHKLAILEMLKTLNDDIGDADGSNFEHVLDLSFKNRPELLNSLIFFYETKKLSDPKLANSIKELISIVYDKIILDKDVDKSYPLNTLRRNWEFPVKKNLRSPYFEEILIKLNDYRDFFFHKSINDQYLPTIAPKKGSAKGFEDFSITELQSMFVPSKFYQLSQSQMRCLCQAFVNKYCEFYNIEPCAVEFKSLQSRPGYTIFGEYRPNIGVIEINENFIYRIDEKNPVQPLKLMCTLAHEAEHRKQFATLDNSQISLRDQIVSHALKNPNSCEWLSQQNQAASTYAKYLSSPDELGARDTALASLRTLSELCKQYGSEDDFNIVATYFNLCLADEQQNQKLEIREDFKAAFDNIYGASYIQTTASSSFGNKISLACQTMKSTVNGSSQSVRVQ